MKAGESLRKQRNKLGITIREMAAENGLSASYLLQIENGVLKNLTLQHMCRMSEAYQMPLKKIVTMFVEEWND